MMEIKHKIKNKKIPTPTTFKLCPLCDEPLKSEWVERRAEVLFHCKNGECELQYLTIKN